MGRPGGCLSYFGDWGEDVRFRSALSRLRATDDHSERNQLAMDLAATRRPEVLEALIDLIRKPDLKNNRGTLVYSLEPYDCRAQLNLLVELVMEGNFEVAHEAGVIIANLLPLNQDEFQFLRMAYDRMMSVTFIDGWRNELINDLSGELTVW